MPAKKMKKNTNTPRQYDVAVIRALAITFVVAFHAYGMMYAEHFPKLKDAYHSIYFLPNQCYFINIAMPMFVFISGYLFSYLLAKGKYPTFIGLVENKAKRILLPYFCFGLIMMATTNDFHPMALLHGGYWHLWFLPMIFWCFIVAYLQNRISFKGNLVWVGFIFVLSFTLPLGERFLPRVLGLHNLTQWYCWFYLGGLVFTYKDKLTSILKNKIVLFSLLTIYVIINALSPTEYGDDYWYSELSQLSIILFLWYIAHIIKWERLPFINSILSLSNYSYGIYIFHNWIQLYLISKTTQRLLPLDRWATDHTILFPLCFFALSLVISYYLTMFTLKTRVGRFLIG